MANKKLDNTNFTSACGCFQGLLGAVEQGNVDVYNEIALNGGCGSYIIGSGASCEQCFMQLEACWNQGANASACATALQSNCVASCCP